MPLFGSKPKKGYLFISYRLSPPTDAQKEEIVSSFGRGKMPVVFAQARPLPKEWETWSSQLREAHIGLETSVYLAQKGIGQGPGKLKQESREMSGFLVTIVSGDLD